MGLFGKKNKKQDIKVNSVIKALVRTRNEFKKFCTYDGMGFQLLQQTGIKVGILTSEDRQLNRRRAKKLGLDLPIFYISISNIASTDTLYKVQDRYHKANLEALTHQCGNWQAVSDYYLSLLTLQKLHESFKVKDLLSSK